MRGAFVCSPDAGRTWKDSVAPNQAPVVGLAYDAGAVYAVTATTLFESRDDGKTFRAIAGGFGSDSGLAITSVRTASGELLVVAKSIARAMAERPGGSSRKKGVRSDFSAPSGPGGWYRGLHSDDGLWFPPTAV